MKPCDSKPYIEVNRAMVFSAGAVALNQLEMKLSTFNLNTFSESPTLLSQRIIKLGKIIGEGGYSFVFEDQEDSDYVIKHFDYLGKNYIPEIIKDIAMHESHCFNLYYGEHASEVIEDQNNQLYIRMLKVPGKPLSDYLKTKMKLPFNSRELLNQMICRLADLDIYHNDLQPKNIMYTPSCDAFHPIDISNFHQKYNSKDANHEDFDSIKEYRYRLTYFALPEKNE